MGDNNWARIDKMMSYETMDAVSRSLGQLASTQTREFCVVLHGGEPLLLGKSKLRYLLNALRKTLPSSYPISLQTNGILISQSILDLCFEFRTTIAVSIDGPQHIHDIDRVDHRSEGTFERVLGGIKKLSSHRHSDFLYAGVLAVINPLSDPKEVYSFFKALDPPSVDFLYRDGNHSRLPPGKSSVHSTEYGSWMVGLLGVYLADHDPTPIRIIDDMLKVLLGGSTSKEGTGITDFGIIIIDTDGSIAKNDTLKSAARFADRFDESWTVMNGSLLNLLGSEEMRIYHEAQKPSSPTCRMCPILNICGGGMVTHRWDEKTGYSNPSVFCADQQLLIGRMKTVINQHNLGP